MNAIFMAKLLSLVEPFSTQVPQLVSFDWTFLEPPEERKVHCNVMKITQTILM